MALSRVILKMLDQIPRAFRIEPDPEAWLFIRPIKRAIEARDIGDRFAVFRNHRGSHLDTAARQKYPVTLQSLLEILNGVKPYFYCM